MLNSEIIEKFQMLTERQTAEILGVSRTTLWRWRKEKKGPPPIKMESYLRYSLCSVLAWLHSQMEWQD